MLPTSASAKPSAKLIVLGLLIVGMTAIAAELSAGMGVWTSGGPYGGDVSAIAAAPSDPGIIYAAAGVNEFWFSGPPRVFRSDDRGRSWSTRSGLADAYVVYGLAVSPLDPDVVLAAALGGVYRSTDGGGHWNRAPGNVSFSSVAFDPNDSSVAFGASSGGVFKSLDGGATWGADNPGLPDPSNCAFANLSFDPGSPEKLFVGTCRGLFETSDAGATWHASGQGMAIGFVSAVAVDPNRPDVLFAASDVVYRSTDRGATWVSFDSGLPSGSDVMALEVSLDENQVLAVVSPQENSENLYTSPSSVAAWAPATGAPRGVRVLGRAPGSLLLGAKDGVYASFDEAATWAPSSPGMRGVAVSALERSGSGDVLFAGTVAGELWTSADNGGSWNRLSSFRNEGVVGALAVDPGDPAVILAASWQPQSHGTSGSLQRTDDGGATWSSDATGLPGGQISQIIFDPARPGRVYAAVLDQLQSIFALPGAVYRSDDGGVSWTLASPGSETGPFTSFTSVCLDPSETSTLFAADGSLWKSTDEGLSWTKLDLGTSSSVELVAAGGGSPPAVYAVLSDASGVWATGSIDGGQRWSAPQSLAPPGSIASSIRVFPSGFAAVALGGPLSLKGGLFFTSDAGRHWHLPPIQPPDPGIAALSADPKQRYLDAGTTSGVYDLQMGRGPASVNPVPPVSPAPVGGRGNSGFVRPRVS
jgi:photosystem II stability/assembly factor-like uncharacterized protein